ncbi:hypothetical protein T484DRAFT_1944408 [Baffinella frigidus]|nr:hypothetical protein T484DRAFT_1944408 [Cryptophyta sp. CCMP2293]|mmetsp:Transcript_58336/g.138820  ORF Transcript_58336/g.138820 Transcript_58336/m.138820 type:complete len:171 (+) Transcript_58336:129-641(+)
MFSIKTLALTGAIVGATAFAPVGRGISAPELRVAAPRICTQGSAVVMSMSGDGTTTLSRPSATETLRREKLTKRSFQSFDADNSSTINLNELKMAARFDEQRRPLSEVLLRRWLRQNWLRPDASTNRIQDVVTRLDLNGDGEVDFGEYEEFMKREVFPDASFCASLQLPA